MMRRLSTENQLMKHLKPTILALSIVLISQQSIAGGFQFNGQSASGLGRAFAGDAVIADTAATIARNPATLTFFETTTLSVGAVFVDTDVSFKNAQYTYFNGAGYSSMPLNDVQDISGESIAPHLFITHPVTKDFSIGLGLYSNFATTTEYQQDFIPDLFGGTTKVRSANLQLSAAYQVDAQWSLGAGIDIIFASGELYREFKAAGLNSNAPALDVKTDGFALGWHVGAVYQFNSDHRFGLSYRYSPTLHFDGDFIFQGNDVKNDTLNIPLPSMVEFSGFHQISRDTSVHYSAQFIQWSSFDALTTDKVGVFKQYNWRDTYHVSLGTTHQVNEQWTVRAGYMYDMGAVDQQRSIAIPDSDRQWLSVGVSYQLDQRSSIDVGLTILMGKDTLVTEQQYQGQLKIAQVVGTTRANATLFALSYNLSL